MLGVSTGVPNYPMSFYNFALIASLPILKLYYNNPKENTPKEDAPVVNDDNWEAATEEDLHSDQYELDS